MKTQLPIVTLDIYHNGQFFSGLEYQHNCRTYYQFLYNEEQNRYIPYNKSFTWEEVLNPVSEICLPLGSEESMTFRDKVIGYAVWKDGKFYKEIITND